MTDSEPDMYMADVEPDMYEVEFKRVDVYPFDLDAGGGNWSKSFRETHSKMMELHRHTIPALPGNMEALGVSAFGVLARQDNGNHYIVAGVARGEPFYVPCQIKSQGRALGVINFKEQ